MGFFDDLSKAASDVGKAAGEAARNVQESMAENQRQAQIARAERSAQDAVIAEKVKGIIVTTGDLRQEYEIIRPVFFQVSNKGIFSSKFSKLAEKYSEELKQLEQSSKSVLGELAMGLFLNEWSANEDDFEKAFFMATEELKRKAFMLGGDAVIHMKQDIDLDTNGFQYFYLQMYGTAVKIKG
ncbi:MAG: hypothetical protein J5477_02170 [Schwartzia sp.]|nr:hypothetical protein [Schwartzia sp. (in: firmicutes)]